MRTSLYLFLLCCLLSLNIFAQPEETNSENEEVVATFQISDINDKEEAVNTLISSSRKELKRLSEQVSVNITDEIDSLQILIEPYTDEYILNLSAQRLKNLHSTVDGISQNIKSIQAEHNSRVKKLQDIETSLKTEQKYWVQFLSYLNESENAAQSLIERVELILTNLSDTREEITSVMKVELDNSSQYSKYNTELSVLQDLISDQDERLRNSYLVSDSEPIWKIHKVAKDTTTTKARAKAIYSENSEALNLYLKFNNKVLLLHFLIIIILFLLFRYSQNLSSSILSKNELEHLASFSKKPLATAFIYSFLFISFSSTGYPIILLEFYLISLFVPIYHLLKTYIKTENRKYIIIFIVLFSIQLILNHISYIYISGRFYLLSIELAIFVFLAFLIGKFKQRPLDSDQRLLRNGFIIAALLFLGSIIANIIGVVKLSLLLSVSTINSIGIGMLIFLFFQISKAFFIVLAEIRPFSGLNIIKEHKILVIKRLVNLTRVLLIFLFIRAVLKQFKLFKPIVESWQDFVTKSWELGEISITIGDFLNFFILITITVLVSRFIKYLLRSELLPRFISKRGVPNAISTSVYYTIMVIGFFIAAFSTGIEWGKVNLAIGALGVGIGFGLQNVVYNFIAGLILIYERPVQEGDIVQLDTLMGSIREIGIRSSRVQTYDGAEVVVPNGNLISNEVINWTLSNNNKRQELKFKASTNANPKEIVEILKTVPLQNPKVNTDTQPLALFEGYGDDGTLDFRLLFWTHVDVGLSSKSEVALAIYEELQKRGYELPVQKSTIRIEKD